jgi:RNA polymerase sigma-70 factor (ECF subfamily)
VTSSHPFTFLSDDPRVRREGGARPSSALPRTTRAASSQRSPCRHSRRVPTDSEAQDQTLQELLLTSRERFVRIAYRILQNKEDAEDAVQDAFLSACRCFRGFEGRSALTTWFTRIVINAALMVRRKRKNAQVRLQELDADGAVVAETIPDVRPTPELACSQAESREILDALLDRMNPLLREALTMTYRDGLSIAEASSALGVPQSTYKARLFRGRRLLESGAENLLPIPPHATWRAASGTHG